MHFFVQWAHRFALSACPATMHRTGDVGGDVGPSASSGSTLLPIRGYQRLGAAPSENMIGWVDLA
jgi:hypothetical protein